MATVKKAKKVSPSFSKRLGNLLQGLISSLRKIVQPLSKAWQTTEGKKWIVTLITTIALVLTALEILGLTYLPHTHPFEGKLIVKQFGFTTSDPSTLFLKNVRIKSINISGKQKFKLLGESQNAKLNRKPLSIALDNESSQWSITAKQSLTLKELRLRKDARIRNIKFSSYNKNLSFTIEPKSEPTHFVFNPGNDPVEIYWSGNFTTDPPLSNNKLDLLLSEFAIDLPEKITVHLELTNSDDRIFWGELNANNVKFISLIESPENFPDEFAESTIVGGSIRMTKQTLTLQENQFLLVEKPGIKVLRNIKILNPTTQSLVINNNNIQLAEPVKGIELSLSGLTKKIQIGINSRLPIEEISGGWLIGVISLDTIILILGALFGIIVPLIVWLFNNFPPTP